MTVNEALKQIEAFENTNSALNHAAGILIMTAIPSHPKEASKYAR